jgi:uncharacterized protein
VRGDSLIAALFAEEAPMSSAAVMNDMKDIRDPVRPIAPWWHTALVLLLVGGGSLASFYQHGLPNAKLPGMSSRLSGYFTVIVEEWVLVLLVWLALKRRGLSFGELVGGRWHSAKDFFRDLGLGIALIVVVVPTVSGLMHLLRFQSDKTLATLTPKTIFEVVVWLVLSWSAAFGEELVFRGYLMRQFGGWTGSRLLGVVLQGVAFGLAHGYYGKAMLVIMVHGCLLGLMATWRKSLLPGMLSHGVQDSLGGIVAFFSHV